MSFQNTSPQMCGYYSITSDREFDETASSLRYFKQPLSFPLDLNKGLDSIKDKPNSYFEEKMDSILTYIVKNKADFVCHPNEGDALIRTKYITYRGILRKIMCSPYEDRNGWCVVATKYKNNIYLGQRTRPEDRSCFQYESAERFSYYGPKFEQYCLTDDPFHMPDPSQEIDACSQFFGVFKRMLVGRNFLFAGEMDGIISDTPVNLHKSSQLNQLKFIELKVAADPSISMFSPEKFIRLKCQNAWTQSFLTGVGDVYFGMRDKWGIVRKIEHYNTKNLLHLGRNYWNPSTSFKFLDEFLKLVEAKTDNIDCPDTVFKFSFDEKTLNITCTKYPGKNELSMLPDWYLNHLTN